MLHHISAMNAPDAWAKATCLVDAALRDKSPSDSRPGRAVRALDFPVITTYERPCERVIFDPVRDANPLFHCFEALWLLAGRDDAAWLDNFVKDYSARFAESDGRQHGSYGVRWRSHFLFDRESVTVIDQLDECVRLLKENKLDRQAVIQMWDPTIDLGVHGLKDKPCNTSAYLRADRGVLDLTVLCRSNDLVWGAYGANVVHFSMLQEYLAARIGILVGQMTQFSNNWHVYDDALNKINAEAAVKASRTYPGIQSLVDHPESFDEELERFLSAPEDGVPFKNRFLSWTARYMWLVNSSRRAGYWGDSLRFANCIEAPDWCKATVEWVQRRIAARERAGHG